jgi:hypothetical protein
MHPNGYMFNGAFHAPYFTAKSGETPAGDLIRVNEIYRKYMLGVFTSPREVFTIIFDLISYGCGEDLFYWGFK